MRDGAHLEASERDHRAEYERPYPHDATAHFIRHDRLQYGVRCREKKEHSKSGNQKTCKRSVKISTQRKGEQSTGKQPNATKRQPSRCKQMSVSCYDQRTDESADPARRHQDSVAVCTAIEHVARKRWHQHSVRPAEDTDCQEKQ